MQALSLLGIAPESCIFLGYPDQEITELLMNGDRGPVERIAFEISRFRPDLLVVPSEFDTHPDHSALGVLVRFACLAYDGCGPIGMLHYLIHTRSGTNNPVPGEVELPLTRNQQEKKRQAISSHATQMKLGRGRLLRLAGPSEKFSTVIECKGIELQHPVRRARVWGGSLQLSLVTRNHLGAFGQRTLRFVGLQKDGSRRAFSLVMPGRSGEAALRDAASEEVLTMCRYQGDRATGELSLPTAALGCVQRLFVKVERRFGFFDEAGWREVHLPEQV